MHLGSGHSWLGCLVCGDKAHHALRRIAAFLYFLLDYTYLGAAQISVYAGGMVMMYIFAVQLVNKRTLQGLVEHVKGSRALSGALLCIIGLVTVAGIQLKNGFLNLAVEGKEVPMETIGSTSTFCLSSSFQCSFWHVSSEQLS